MSPLWDKKFLKADVLSLIVFSHMEHTTELWALVVHDSLDQRFRRGSASDSQGGSVRDGYEDDRN